MSRTVVLTEEAEADLAEAVEWYEERSQGLGTDLLAQVRQTLRRIQGNPRLQAETYRGIRRASVPKFPYGVLYRWQEDRITVIAVFHDRRDPTRWQQRV